jgi:sialic acid synthase SpsE
MRVGSIDTDDRVLVVAEVGNNHEGSADRARALVRAAAEAGADVVKFQTFRTESFVSNADPARVARLRSFELSFDVFAELAALARSLGLLFVSTPLDLESAAFLATICDALKIASGDNDYRDLMLACARSGLPLVVSSGMTTEGDIAETVAWLRASARPKDLAVLHCVSSYPAPPEQLNLRAIPLLAERLGCTVGYSDHSLGLEACAAAVALGARVVEKHFTLDKNQSDFRDHQLSADPSDLAELVRRVRALEPMLGARAKALQPCEVEIARVARRSAAARRKLPAGHVIARDDLVFLRPGTGVRCGREEELVGRRLTRDVEAGTLLGPGDAG